MPWRTTRDPYRIWISEIMLQQTQVSRVIPKYKKFIRRFPNIGILANATFRSVLHEWSGLGYNRRALLAHRAARIMMEKHAGTFPRSVEAIRALPGVGHATASAILNYAYEIACPYIETNIRTVFIYHFFPKKKKVSDEALWPHVVASLDERRPGEWHWALMDYGAFLKCTRGNISRKSDSYQKQSLFPGSQRQMRAAILRGLLKKPQSISAIRRLKGVGARKAESAVRSLVKDGLIERRGAEYRIV